MNNEIKKFLERKDERKNSASAKLKLLVHGVKDFSVVKDKFFKREHYAYDNDSWRVDKDRFTQLLLPGGIVSKIHIRPESQYALHIDNEKLYLKDENNSKFLSEFMFLPRPNFWNYTTSTGTHAKKLAQPYGLNCLNFFNIYSGCDFHNAEDGCKFCYVKTSAKRDDTVKFIKSPNEIAEVCELATKYDEFEYVIIHGGSNINSEKEFDRYINIIKAIKDRLPWNGQIKGNVALMPPKNMNRLKELHELGVEHPSFNMEVWGKKNFDKICPGKAKYVGFEHIVKSLLHLAEIYGKGQVWSNFVAGIVPIENYKEGFKFLAEHGIVPGANVYCAESYSIGNPLRTINEDYVLDLYRYGNDLYNKYGYKPYFNTLVLRNSLANEVFEGLL